MKSPCFRTYKRYFWWYRSSHFKMCECFAGLNLKYSEHCKLQILHSVRRRWKMLVSGRLHVTNHLTLCLSMCGFFGPTSICKCFVFLISNMIWPIDFKLCQRISGNGIFTTVPSGLFTHQEANISLCWPLFDLKVEWVVEIQTKDLSGIITLIINSSIHTRIVTSQSILLFLKMKSTFPFAWVILCCSIFLQDLIKSIVWFT